MTPAVVISLDFELRWGLLDVLGADASRYRTNLEGVRDAVPRLLEAFASRGVGATWATVGALACEGWDEWAERVPAPPRYADPALRWRDELRQIDPSGRLHFAKDLVELIAQTPGQELASHTFAHVYVREPGFTREDAVADTDAMVRLFQERWGTVPRSLVFPRNQTAFQDVFEERGITAWRDNPQTFYWAATAAAEQSKTARVLRLVDAVAPLGRRAAPARAQRASYFVRMGLPEAMWRLHRQRMVREAKALRDDEAMHLWWHPHNMGGAPATSVARVAELLDAIREAAPAGTRFASMGGLIDAA